MGIKNMVVRAAAKAGDAIAKVSSLSPEQLEEVQLRRENYLSQMPDPNDPAAEELTHRFLSAIGIEIYSAYLPQIKDLYSPIDPTIEYGRDFDAAHNVRLLNITKWVVDPEEDSLEKLVSVYDVLSSEDCNVALVFNRTKAGTNVFLAVANMGNAPRNTEADNFRKRISEAIKGNFPGSEISDYERENASFLKGEKPLSVASVSNVPTEKSDKFISQTIEKILDGIVPSRRSEEYTIVLLATPIHDVEERKLRLAELYSALAPYSSWQTNFTLTESGSLMSMATVGVNAGVSAGIQNGTNSSLANSSNVTDSTGETVTDSSGETTTDSTGETTTDSTGETTTDSAGSSVSDMTGENESSTAGVEVTAGGKAGVPLVAEGHVDVGVSASHAHGTSTAHTVAENIAHSVANSTGHAVANSVGHAVASSTGRAVANSLGRAVSKGVTKTAGVFQSTNLGGNFGASFSRASSVTATIGKNEGITQSFTNYAIKHALANLEEQMTRLDQASALGMWDFAAYVLSEDQNVANNVAHSYLALTQGEKSYMSQAAVNLWRGDMATGSGEAATICKYLKNFRHPTFALNPNLLVRDPSFNEYPATVTATTALSGRELAFSLNFPRKSVSGLPVIECAEFGRNVTTFEGEQSTGDGIAIGKVFHMHHEEDVEVSLSKDSLASHTFITGSTGSGKTNTVCKILAEASSSGAGFLVIEPAKGEYKDVFGGAEGVSVFGTNPDITPLLRINPFSFSAGIHVLEHLDRLVEVFNVCWPMYAAMPAVLKNAVELSYEDCGWDLTKSSNPYGSDLYPTFADVARNVREILDTSEYNAENKGAYKGSLLTRLQSLTNGINGMVLTNDEIPAPELFDSRVVVDLSRVGSTETKSLLMGLLVLKLQEHRMAESAGANLPLRHITVLEEAHNLLKRTSTEQPVEGANLIGKSVEMLSNAIAEMRTYGEGFIIADQAPGLLDMAAIRNTNTKIVMRLPDLSDRELVGRAANLDDDQIIELARLPKGVAAIYQNDWIQPVLCKIDRANEGTQFAYEPAAAPADSYSIEDAIAVASILAKGTEITDESTLQEMKAAMSRLGLAASMRASILKAMANPPTEPRMTRLAPMMSALFPAVRKAARIAVAQTDDVAEWTRATEHALADACATELEDRVRRVIVQGVITDHVYNELRDEAAFRDWYQKGGMR